MDQEKFVQLQRQMRLNNDDYKNFLDDIDSWSTKMKEKEVNNNCKSNLKRNDLPGIRNISKTTISKPKPPKIKAYDYESWNKFDVDKALQECENSVRDEEEKKDMLTMSNQFKDSGNIFFKEGNYSKAVEEYTTALEYNSNSDVLFTNRAMSSMKLGNYQAGEQDCSEAIRINSNSVKAYYRRAKCRINLNKPQDALEDFKSVLKIEPNNKLAHKEMKELETELNVRGVVDPLTHPLIDRQSNKPLIRIDIVDVDPNRHFESIPADQHIANEPGESVTSSNQIIPEDVSENIQFKLPQTSVQLAKDLSNFRKNPKHLAIYVAALEYKNFKKLIGHALDCEFLLDIVNGLSFALQYQLIEQEPFICSLNCLFNVSRFSTSWIMISDEEKINFRKAMSMVNQIYLDKLQFSH